jgi:integrase
MLMGFVYKRPDSKYWWISYQLKHKQIRESTKSSRKSVALEALKHREMDIIRGIFRIKKRSPYITFKELANIWLSRHSKIKNAPSSYQKNKERLEKHLIPFFGKYQVDEITPRLIDEYVASRIDVIGPPTINRTLAILSKMFNDAIRWEYLFENPVKKVERLKEKRGPFNYLKRNEVKRLLEACTQTFYPVALCAVYTGMRASEIAGLRWRNVDLKKGIITLTETKSGKIRHVPINKKLKSCLEEIHEHRESIYVFARKGGRKRSRDFRFSLNRATEKAVLRHTTPHDLRHTFASNFIMSGGRLRSLQKILGHSEISMTLRYAHLAPDFLRDEINLLDYDD